MPVAQRDEGPIRTSQAAVSAVNQPSDDEEEKRGCGSDNGQLVHVGNVRRGLRLFVVGGLKAERNLSGRVLFDFDLGFLQAEVRMPGLELVLAGGDFLDLEGAIGAAHREERVIGHDHVRLHPLVHVAL